LKLHAQVLSRKTEKISGFEIINIAVKPVYNGHPWDLKNVAVMQRVV
jgi:hypothetical protein